MSLFAPRMWRCFFFRTKSFAESSVCSTHVEMFPRQDQEKQSLFCLLHACGDVSRSRALRTSCQWFAPRMWRCFSGRVGCPGIVLVCSTHVEMFLFCIYLQYRCESLLHACGDVSRLSLMSYPKSLFAPRMWRCFSARTSWQARRSVCSTHVEMFLPQPSMSPISASLLHACGDVSIP